MTDCIFCKIISGEAKGTIVFKDDLVTAFRDIHPVAPTHILIVPNKHIASINDLKDEDAPLMGHLLTTAKKIAEMENIKESGYRLLINTGRDANQVVFHIHLHIMGGGRMKYPMG